MSENAPPASPEADIATVREAAIALAGIPGGELAHRLTGVADRMNERRCVS